MASSGFELKDIQEDVESTTEGPKVLVVGGRHGPQIGHAQKPQLIRQEQSVTSSGTNNNLIVDRYKLVFIIFLIHGVGTLMPWNMFCNADDYFRQYKLAPVNDTTPEVREQLVQIRKNFFSYLGMASQIPNLVFAGLNLLVDVGSGNLKIRVNFALIVELLVFIVTIILASIDSTQRPVAFFYVTMFSVVILNMVSGIYQNCIFGTTAKFPSLYTNAVLIGSNLSGTYTSVIMILSLWMAPEHKTAATYYFITAIFVILVCFITYNLLPTIKFFEYHDKKQEEEYLEIDTSQNPIISSGTGNISSDVPENLRVTVDAMVPRLVTEKSFTDRFNEKLQVFKKCRLQLFNVYLTFFVTLALFPSVLASIEPKQMFLDKKYYGPVFCFLTFNASALIGNVISYYTSWPGKERVWIFTVARLLFIPFFIFCNYQPNSESTRSWPVLIPYDLVFLFGNMLLALTSGYLSSICMMFVSIGLKRDEATLAGMLGGFFLIFGIFSGVMSTFFTTWLVSR